MLITLENNILHKVPNFKIGMTFHRNIVIDESPKMLKGRLQFFQEKIRTDLLNQTIFDYSGVFEWQDTFKQLGIDPKRYRPSHEALFHRIGKGNDLPFIHSAADLNNFFSLQYEIPIGIYDLNTLDDYIKISLGTEGDSFEGLNGRTNNMYKKPISYDKNGAFGSPIVDSKRSKTDRPTTDVVQIFYLKPSMELNETNKLLKAASKMFTQLHSGDSVTYLLHKNQQEIITL
ncbi:DNA/RNA-binding domain of Phe-tRNA-synthetase-like protein [Salibacterium salarium]|uniref:B3/B4 domain-containing protein n=1 Tax=Salibacterium salarium TaxID=284579 RepID=UPI002789738A|nr:phenylalanine--tRNA ligase beta subunit-related protein [Salibacterium salarium]MDQ0299920.1 DNA/RNA-binding domain of Phe-tRNA-synthetase-like protein [Salibacterium salarium]